MVADDYLQKDKILRNYKIHVADSNIKVHVNNLKVYSIEVFNQKVLIKV